MFVVGCRFDPARPLVYRCVAEILRFHPRAEIVVVDSDSPDRSYAGELRALGIRVETIGNRHYEVGALWHAFERFPRDHYFFLQDSALVKDNLDDLRRHPVSGMMYWRDWEGCQPCHLERGRELLAATDYSWLDSGFPMVFGCMLFAQRGVLEQLRRKNLHRALPTDKAGSAAMERVLGIALQHEGYGDLVPRTFLSEWIGVTEQAGDSKVTRTPRLDKVWLGRS